MYTDPDRSPVSFIHGQVHTTIKSALGDIRLQECDNIVLIADWMTPFPKVSPELQAMVEIRPTAIISRTQSDNDYYAAGSLPFVDYLKHHLPLPGRLDAWVYEEVPDTRHRGKKKAIGAFQYWQQNLTEETVLPVYWLVQSQLSMVPYAYRSIFNNEIQSEEIQVEYHMLVNPGSWETWKRQITLEMPSNDHVRYGSPEMEVQNNRFINR